MIGTLWENLHTGICRPSLRDYESGMLEESDGASVVYLGGKWVNREGEPSQSLLEKVMVVSTTLPLT